MIFPLSIVSLRVRAWSSSWSVFSSETTSRDPECCQVSQRTLQKKRDDGHGEDYDGHGEDYDGHGDDYDGQMTDTVRITNDRRQTR